MTLIWKRDLVIVLIFSLIFLQTPAARGEGAKPDERSKASTGSESNCRAEFLVDAASGTVLFEQNPDQALAPASMIKLMGTYVILKQIKHGSIKPDDLVTVSARASKTGGSQVYLKQGEQFTVQQLLQALLIQSANDAAIALAEHIGGSTEGFVELMRSEAEALGLKNYEFNSPHGLPPAKDQKPDLMSARDFAILSRALISEFPDVLAITKTTNQGFRGDSFMMQNHNHLLNSFNGCDGLKTGYYTQAGFSIAATAERKGVRMIALVMGCNDRKKRDAETARLLSMGLSQYKSVKLMEKNSPVGESVAVINGKKKRATPVVTEDIMGTVRIKDEKRIVKTLELCKEVQAPVPMNTPCGGIKFLVDDHQIAYAPTVIAEEIPKGGLLDKLWNKIEK